MKPEREFELLLTPRKIVKWRGKDGKDAAERYADCHPDVTVLAWRHPKTEIVIGLHPIKD